VGRLPILLMVLFGFTQCPLVLLGGYTCHDPNQGDGGWFFVAAVAAYALQALAMLVCFISRWTRPVAWGLLLMCLLGPIVGVYAFYLVAELRHTHPTNTNVVVGLPAASRLCDGLGPDASSGDRVRPSA
jgi:hypothetical protein